MAGSFNNDPTTPLFIPVHPNFLNLVVVLPEVIHPLNSNTLLRKVVDSGSDDNDLD